ncbi:MAG: hypothetical protein ABSA76_02345, partial [Bacteroidales bacterium]
KTMRTETTTRTLYSYSELSEEAKQKAIENLWDINIDYDWFDFTEEDARQIGLNIKEFDIDRASFVKGEFINSAPEVAEAIMQNHGKDCETYKTAKTFLDDLNALTGQYPNIEDAPEDEMEELEDEFLKSICEDYRIILTKEYEYLTSEEAIIETIKANEYEFTEDGKLA